MPRVKARVIFSPFDHAANHAMAHTVAAAGIRDFLQERRG